MNIIPEKIHGLMDENYYWATVNASTIYSHDKDLQLSFLVNSLKEMPLDDIVSFMLRTHQLQNYLYTSHVWCAGYLMNRGYCSSDNRFEYFRSWIISCGRDTYYSASNKPDSLENKINSEIEYYEYEEFG